MAIPFRAALWSGAPLGLAGARTPFIVFSRVASFASRTAQALLGPDLASAEAPPLDCSAPGRVQLYVDDPIVSVRASEERAHATLDLVVLWWLVLGIPCLGRKVFSRRGWSRTAG